jgi:DNA repair protein RecO (recombination protein O)
LALEWQAQAIVLDLRPYGESDAVVTVLTEAHGLYRGLAHGGGSRARAALWQPGNVLQARWVARLADQLGAVSGEFLDQPGARVLDDKLSLALLRAACATAAGSLPEREPHPAAFAALAFLLDRLGHGPAPVADLIRGEIMLLAELGYGLDLSACAVSGRTQNLAHVSPRTGRAVSAEAAGVWRDRLLKLPPLLLDAEDSGDPVQWRDGLRLTGHFLARDAFGQHHRPLPQARIALYQQVTRLAEATPMLDQTDA